MCWIIKSLRTEATISLVDLPACVEKESEDCSAELNSTDGRNRTEASALWCWRNIVCILTRKYRTNESILISLNNKNWQKLHDWSYSSFSPRYIKVQGNLYWLCCLQRPNGIRGTAEDSGCMRQDSSSGRMNETKMTANRNSWGCHSM